MRLLGPVLAGLLAAPFAVSTAARSAHAEARPSMTASVDRFELFGTSFCYTDPSAARSCDVSLPTLPPQAMTVAPPRVDHAARTRIFGISFCDRAVPTGPACDVVWTPPQPAQPWRDMPEMRLAEVMPAP